LFVALQNQVNKNFPRDEWKGRVPFDLEDDRGVATKKFKAIEKYRKHPAQVVQEKFKRYFGDVRIMPQHLPVPKTWRKADPLLGYLFCDALVDVTPTICEAVKNDRIKTVNYQDKDYGNKATGLNADYFADSLYQQGLIPPDSKRNKIMDEIEETMAYYNISDGDFAIKCMPKEVQEKLEELSYDVEFKLFAEKWAKEKSPMQMIQENHKGFTKDVLNNRKHCFVDTKKTLRKPVWDHFIKKISGKSTDADKPKREDQKKDDKKKDDKKMGKK
jgi:hypothetical protein